MKTTSLQLKLVFEDKFDINGRTEVTKIWDVSAIMVFEIDTDFVSKI